MSDRTIMQKINVKDIENSMFYPKTHGFENRFLMVVRLLRHQYGSPIHLLSLSCSHEHHKGCLKQAKVTFISKVSVVTCECPLDNRNFD